MGFKGHTALEDFLSLYIMQAFMVFDSVLKPIGFRAVMGDIDFISMVSEQ